MPSRTSVRSDSGTTVRSGGIYPVSAVLWLFVVKRESALVATGAAAGEGLGYHHGNKTQAGKTA